MGARCASPARANSHLRVPGRYPSVSARGGASRPRLAHPARSAARSSWDHARTFVPPVGDPMHRLSVSKLRARKRSRGQGLVEFALAAPVLILILLIAIDAGRLF